MKQILIFFLGYKFHIIIAILIVIVAFGALLGAIGTSSTLTNKNTLNNASNDSDSCHKLSEKPKDWNDNFANRPYVVGTQDGNPEKGSYPAEIRYKIYDPKTDMTSYYSCYQSGETPSDLDQWVNWALNSDNWNSFTNANNRGIDVDNGPDGYGHAQCVDIPKSWIKAHLGLNYYPLLTAWEGTKIVAGGVSFPPSGIKEKSVHEPINAGDIVFFNFGHTAVVIENQFGNNTFKVIEQNPWSPKKSIYSTKNVSAVFSFTKEKAKDVQ